MKKTGVKIFFYFENLHLSNYSRANKNPIKGKSATDNFFIQLSTLLVSNLFLLEQINSILPHRNRQLHKAFDSHRHRKMLNVSALTYIKCKYHGFDSFIKMLK